MVDKQVSVVIPTYNYGRFVVDAVNSVLAQTYRDFEIIVVNDGSTDDTEERLKPLLHRIRYIRQDNQGLAAARNAGIRAAAGQWIAFLDSDDQWHPRKLEVQMTYLASHPDVALLAADSLKDVSGGWPDIAEGADPPAERIGLDDIVIRSRFGPSCVVVRKDCFEKTGLFDSSLASAEDRDMWIRIACDFPTVILHVPLWWYRVHSSSMSYHTETMVRSERQVLQKTFAEHASLRRNWLTRLQSYSYFARSSAYSYDTAGHSTKALAQILYSLALWPLPFARRHSLDPLERPKKLVLIVLRMLGLRKPDVVSP
jgi:glycosyltransferase involved in cell wall biosynthesis